LEIWTETRSEEVEVDRLGEVLSRGGRLEWLRCLPAVREGIDDGVLRSRAIRMGLRRCPVPGTRLIEGREKSTRRLVVGAQAERGMRGRWRSVAGRGVAGCGKGEVRIQVSAAPGLGSLASGDLSPEPSCGWSGWGTGHGRSLWAGGDRDGGQFGAERVGGVGARRGELPAFLGGGQLAAGRRRAFAMSVAVEHRGPEVGARLRRGSFWREAGGPRSEGIGCWLAGVLEEPVLDVSGELFGVELEEVDGGDEVVFPVLDGNLYVGAGEELAWNVEPDLPAVGVAEGGRGAVCCLGEVEGPSVSHRRGELSQLGDLLEVSGDVVVGSGVLGRHGLAPGRLLIS